MIELLHITKRFGAFDALADVSLTIDRGQVHGLLGENGAGKSTLMNILFGLLRPDAGTIRIAGREARLRSPRAAQSLGIGMVHQHFKLVPTLTVAQNCALFLRVPVRTAQGRAQAWLDRLHWQVPLQPPVERLTVGQQQRLEIIKALLAIEHAGAAGGPDSKGTLILDEPTAVLTPQEIAELFAAIRTLRAAGTGVIFISHKLAEVRQICDAITILRRGRVVHTGPTTELSPEAMAEKMVGAKVELPHLPRSAAAPAAPPVLELRNLSTGQLRAANLLVYPGQIVGIAGVDGNGQADLVNAIVGAHRPDRGILRIAGHDAARRTVRWRADHVAYVPEDRQHDALVLPLSIEDNLLLKNYRSPHYATLPPIHWLRFDRWRRRADELVAQFDVRCRSVTDPVGRLSGGNQQKVVVARELSAWDADGGGGGGAQRKSLVIAVNPTRGLDVAATAFVMQQLLAARSAGAGVLLVHSDLDELLAISDRVLVIFSGRLMETRWPATTRETIGRMMLGIAGADAGGPP